MPLSVHDEFRERNHAKTFTVCGCRGMDITNGKGASAASVSSGIAPSPIAARTTRGVHRQSAHDI